MLSIEQKIYELAGKRDPKTGKWLLSRRGIQKLVPGVSEWKVRQIMKEVRGESSPGTPAPTPEERVVLKREQEQVKLPSLIFKVLARKAVPPRKSTIEHWVIGSDVHAPYHDKESCEILYQITEELNPSTVILLGDVLNLDQFSKYDGEGKYPGAPTWLEEVAVAGEVLAQLRLAAPNATLRWFEGNHELRLKKHLMRHDPILYSNLNIPKLFVISDNETAKTELKQWEYFDRQEEFNEDLGLIIKHGTKVRKHSGMSAQAEVDDLLFSVIMGHCHRLGLYRRSSGRSRYLNEQPLFGMETGCLCRYDLPYVEGSTSNWQHGFGVLTIDTSPTIPVIEPTIVEINNHKALFRGKIYRA